MARRRSSNEKLLFFFLFELPFYAVRLSLLVLKWTVEVAVEVFSVASELVASCSNKRGRKNPVHEVLIWPGRRKDPLHVLVAWLLLIWLSVLYIYINIHSEPAKQSRAASVGTGSSSSTSSPSKQTGKKQKEKVSTPSRPSTKTAKRDSRKASSVPSINEAKHTESPSKDQPTDASSYLAMVQRRIINGWHPPSIAEPLEVVIRFTLIKSGRVTDIAIEKSSGNEYFDVAAELAVLSASPLPVLPADSEDEMMTRLRFSNKS